MFRGMKLLSVANCLASVLLVVLAHPTDLLAQGFLGQRGDGEHQRPGRGEAATALTAAELEALRAKAHKGDVEAQFELGLYLYDQLPPFQRDYTEGKEWLRRSAEKGHPRGQYWYAWSLHRSDNYTEAAKWFLRAANQGHAEAQWRLGTYYQSGRGGLQRDLNSAAEWYRRAVAQGFGPARAQLHDVEHTLNTQRKNTGSKKESREICVRQATDTTVAGGPSPRDVCQALELHLLERMHSANAVSAQVLHRFVTGEGSMIEAGIYIDTFEVRNCSMGSQDSDRFICGVVYRLESEREAPMWFELFGKGQDLVRTFSLARQEGGWKIIQVH